MHREWARRQSRQGKLAIHPHARQDVGNMLLHVLQAHERVQTLQGARAFCLPPGEGLLYHRPVGGELLAGELVAAPLFIEGSHVGKRAVCQAFVHEGRHLVVGRKALVAGAHLKGRAHLGGIHILGDRCRIATQLHPRHGKARLDALLQRIGSLGDDHDRLHGVRVPGQRVQEAREQLIGIAGEGVALVERAVADDEGHSLKRLHQGIVHAAEEIFVGVVPPLASVNPVEVEGESAGGRHAAHFC